MEKSEFMIKRIFAEEGDLPEIVKMRVQEAYDQIYEQIRAQDASDENNEACENHHAVIRNNGKSLLKVACFVLVCLLALGGTAYAVNLILDRYERMKQMEQEEKDQIYEDIQNGGNLNHEESRTFTESESARFFELREKYKANEAFPEGELEVIREGEKAKGELYLLVKGNHEESVLVLPERELTDEEILQIIEHDEKETYVLHENNEKRFAESADWAKRLAELTDEEVDYYYLAFYSTIEAQSGGYVRAMGGFAEGKDMLSDSEQSRYDELLKAYEEDGRIPFDEAVLIERPDNYTGEGIAVCRMDGNFHLPSAELTDEELLQIIDFRKKAEYSFKRIREDIELGRRDAWPVLPERESEELKNLSNKAFSETSVDAKLSPLDKAEIGDLVEFGSYEQDGDASNGAEKIRWYVLDETEDYYVLLAQQILDARPYHEEQKAVTWAECDLRRWLNQEFLETAFASAEQSRIVKGFISNEFGGETTDQVYLLSDREIYEYFGIDPESVDFKGLGTRGIQRAQSEALDFLDPRLFAKPTEEAKRRGAGTFDQREYEAFLKYAKVDFSKALGNGSWVHRSSRPDLGSIAYTTNPMGTVCSGQYVTGKFGIRPVIRIQR